MVLCYNGVVWMCKQGLYRLAEMVEHGFGYAVGSSILSLLQVPALVAANNVTLVLHLYSRWRSLTALIIHCVSKTRATLV